MFDNTFPGMRVLQKFDLAFILLVDFQPKQQLQEFVS